jgi:uncharacterized protein (DUF1778 family)
MHVRLSAADKLLFRVAADLKGQDMTDFVLSNARAAAEQVIEEQRDFTLPRAHFEAFAAALDRPPVEKSRLRRLFEEPSVLDDDSEASIAAAR